MNDQEKLTNDHADDEDILDFDAIFHDKQENPKPLNPTRTLNAWMAVLVYVSRSFIALLIALLLLAIPALAPSFSLDEIVARNVSLDANGIGKVPIGIANSYAHMVTIYEVSENNTEQLAYIINKLNIDFVDKNKEEITAFLNDIENGVNITWPSGKVITFFYNPEQDMPNTSPEVSLYAVEPYSRFSEMNFTNIGMGLYQLLVMLITTAIVIFILKKELITDFKLFKAHVPGVKKTASILINIFYVFAAQIVLNLLTNLLGMLFSNNNGISENQLLINFINTGGAIPLMMIASIIFAPILEELVFRKGIFGLFKNRNVGLVVSSLAFGLIHVSGELISLDFSNAFLNGLSYIGMGFVFGYIYLKNQKNITASILAHAGYNLIAMIVNLIPFIVFI